jgi:hypothetical protein
MSMSNDLKWLAKRVIDHADAEGWSEADIVRRLAKETIQADEQIAALRAELAEAREYFEAIDELLKEPVEIKYARQAVTRALAALPEKQS